MSEEHNKFDFAINKKRVYDQTASMHFCLSDYYKKLASLEDAAEIAVSVLLCGLTFFNFQQYFPCIRFNQSLIIGIVSIFLFAFTLVKQRMAHKELAEKHCLAGKIYVKSKLDLALKIEEWQKQQISDQEMQEYIYRNFQSLNELPQIPEKKFLKLKHHHQTKVEFSKFLDSHRNDFWFICKLKFRFCGNRKKQKKD